MMQQNDCKCPHHMIQKLVMVLGVVAVLGFWVSTLMGGMLFGISSLHYFKEVVVLILVNMGLLNSCSCCCRSGKCSSCSTEGDGNKAM